MYTVNFIMKNSPNSVTFIFKAFKNADQLYKKANTENLGLALQAEDDYGLIGSIKMQDVSAVTFSEFAKEMDRNADMGLIQHKSNLKAQNTAKTDIGLQVLSKPSAIVQ